MSRLTIASIQVGLPRSYDGAGAGRPWVSAIHKLPVEGPRWLGRTGLQGDAQADRTVHGGPEKAVLVYPLAHHERWRVELEAPDFGPGGVGENFTVEGGDEGTVCIGDVFQAGTGLVQVSQPRAPCRKLAGRWSRPDLPALVVKTGRTGWYLRVLREGLVEPGWTMSLVDRPLPAWPVARVCARTFDRRGRSEAETRALLGLSLLSAEWKAMVRPRGA